MVSGSSDTRFQPNLSLGFQSICTSGFSHFALQVSVRSGLRFQSVSTPKFQLICSLGYGQFALQVSVSTHLRFQSVRTSSSTWYIGRYSSGTSPKGNVQDGNILVPSPYQPLTSTLSLLFISTSVFPPSSPTYKSSLPYQPVS